MDQVPLGGPSSDESGKKTGEFLAWNRNAGSFPEKLTLRQILVFVTLLLLTVLTTFWAGYRLYSNDVVSGVFYSIALISILGAHEFGHYWAGRRNGVRSSLPFFIPAPPLFIFGTLGALIHVRDPFPNRKILIEVGSAGPIAGFVVAIPLLVVGLFFSEVMVVSEGNGLFFGNSLVFLGLSQMILGVHPGANGLDVWLHPIAFASWVGLFVTALNLLPIGQLDGGQIGYALFKDGFRAFSGFVFITLLLLGFYWAGWWVFAFLTAVFFRFRSAPIIDESSGLEKRHRLLGWASFAIFVVTFMPVPVELLG